ncbi:hypothetical protein TanjilG_05597 [Lupinus angustifolius]|uniref:Pectate lyase superfamily protein domain-containing protein n=1 Tax=Lupinus angustifolius TaxID=3871 RepID=A0A4P1QSD9_LUPAN|nr:hypothetical protein TanjilG_05597 [Lupinus angustifolius]
MDKFFFVSLLGLLLAAHGVLGSMMCDNIAMLQELESLDIEEENEVELSEIPSWKSERGGKVLVNVDSFGAAGNGESDDTEAFRKAWNVSCSTPKSVFLVPQGRIYLINATKFIGPCAGNIIIQIDGKVVAPDEPKNWDPKLPRVWLVFSKLDKAVFQGSGVIDGSGTKCIGSLGKDNSTGIVSKVILDTAVFKDTTNGVRIKTWQTSAVEISEIMYQNISGTTKSAKAIKFDCSDTFPCSNLVLSNVNLEKLDGTVETYCHSAQGFGYGVVHPSAECLNSNDQISQIKASITQDIIYHTEL